MRNFRHIISIIKEIVKGCIFRLEIVYIVLLGVFYIHLTESIAQIATFKISRSEQDSLLKTFTLDELEQYKNIYSREIERLQKQNAELRRRGIRDAEMFLATNPKSELADKIMIRLAELYYDQAQDDFQTAMQKYDSLFAEYNRGIILTPPPEPKKNLQPPLQIYYQLVHHFPHSDFADDAIYNLGLLLEEMGRPDSAFVYYQRLLEEHPTTPLLPDVLMRIGEYYFNPPKSQINEAIGYYNRILEYRHSPRYDEALYRLGWCYYQQHDYARAISYFTLLVDDITRTMPYDPLQRYSNPSLVEEAIEYIGLCFLEYGGVSKAVAYFKEIGERPYIVKVLQRMGDAYMEEKEEYPQALQAYQTILQLYPNDPFAPAIQNRIVQAYRRMDEQAMAFFARDLLFQNYRPGSDWWQENNSRDARNRALMYVESALRDNITVLINRAQETGQEEFYSQAVTESRKYLEYFPLDSLSAMIHWNMALILDTKLHRRTEALEEYLKISQLYINSRYQQAAAKNAVVLAHEAVEEAKNRQRVEASRPLITHIEDLRAQFGANAEKILKFRQKLQVQTTDLTAEEQRLAAAYDNYLTLFPHDSQTPVFLANAGTLYYQHGKFKEALKYFNTLLKHFPNSDEADRIQFAVMESYFGKADFQSTEIVARRILSSGAPEDLKTKARRRLSEAVFLNAELLADENKHLEAGNEYRRLAREDSQGKFVDLAFFNAALEYEKANEFNRAIESYHNLLAYCPDSPLVYDAQNNLAFDYAELNDYRNAALTYERVAASHPDPERARDALYNAAVYYKQLGDFENAIRVHKSFTEKYKGDELADDLAFEIAGIYRQINEPEKAQQAYQQFIIDYPNSPRVVEAHFLRGKYFMEKGQNRMAIAELEKAVASIDSSKKTSEFYAAEAEFALAKAYFREFEQIQFQLPPGELESNKLRKKELLQKIIHHLGNCAAYGTTRLYEATYMIGRAYQVFAQTWEEQQLPPMEPNRKLLAQKEIYEGAALLYERAARAFRQGLQVLSKLAEEYRISVDRNSDSLKYIFPPTTTVTDSVARIADKWIEQCKKGLSAVYYSEANVYYKSALLVMDAPVPNHLLDLQKLDYQYKILQIGAEPLITKSLLQHCKNIEATDSLHLVSEWADLSRQKLPLQLNLLQKRYASIAMDGFEFLQQKLNSYANLLYRAIRNETKQEQMKEHEKISRSTIELCQKAINGALYLLTLDKMQELSAKMVSFILASHRDSLLQTSLDFVEKTDSLISFVMTQGNITKSRFVGNPNPLFEQAVLTFENTADALMRMQQEILKKTYNILKDDQSPDTRGKLLLMHLMKFTPETYANLLGLTIEQQSFMTDSTWKSSTIKTDGWTNPLFDDRNWSPVWIIDNDQMENNFIWIKEDIGQADERNYTDKSRQQRIYFRKTIQIDGYPKDCRIYFSRWTEMDIYFNGYLIKKFPASIMSGSQEIDVCSLVKRGQNVLAIEATYDSKVKGIAAKVNFSYIPGWYKKMAALRNSIADASKQAKSN